MRLDELKALLEMPEWAELAYSNFSDVSFSCFEAANKSKKDPVKFAEDLANNIHSKYIKEIHAINGYVNIVIDFLALNDSSGFLFDRNEGRAVNRFSNKVIRLEHTSVNPNKALHIGHMRNSYIGEFIRRSLLYSSAEVTTSNFIEDTGAQVADIIVGFRYLGKNPNFEGKFDLYCSKVYKEVNELYEKDGSLLENRKKVLMDIEKGDKDTMEMLERLVDKVISAQLVTLSGQKIKYDLLDLERYILSKGIVSKAIHKLLDGKIAFRSESEKNKGCVVTIFDNTEVTLTRSDGTSLYVAKDIAYAMVKHGVLDERIKYVYFGNNYDGSEIKISSQNGRDADLKKIDMSFTLTDSAQVSEQAAVKAIIDDLSGRDSYNHYSYEPVAISKNTANSLGIKTDENFIRMSGRKGITVEFDDLFSAVKKRIEEESNKNGKEIGEEDVSKMASNVIRYYILKVSPSKMVIFDINDATALKGDSAIYLNYSYSRAKSILNKAGKAEKMTLSFEKDDNNFLRDLFFWESVLHN